MMDLFINPHGVINAIYAEAIDLEMLGKPTISRASHVEPDELGHWFAQIVNGPNLGPFAKRSEALTAEINWLTENRLHSQP
jgi:hypothetical protein